MLNCEYKGNEIQYALGQLDENGLWGISFTIIHHSGEETIVRNITAFSQHESLKNAVAQSFYLGKRVIDGELKVQSIKY
jgi:hypothetical protein